MTMEMGEPADAGSPIYLDHNATTPVLPEVFEAMRPWLTSEWGNPSSAHPHGRRAKSAVARARAQVAQLVGAHDDEIIFTSCGSESDNLAIFGVTEALGEQGVLLTSQMEHPAIEAAWERLLHREPAWSLRRLPTDLGGRVKIDSEALAGVAFASVILAHNETGAVQPLGELIAEMRALSPEVIVHSDGAQAVGKIAVDVKELDLDLLTIVGHKFGAPKGVAALYRRRGTPLSSQLVGGGQESGQRAGTEAVAQVVALGAACRAASQRGDEAREFIRARREALWAALAARIPGLHRTVPDEPSLPNTLHVCVPGRDGRELLAAAPGIAASTGSACHADSDAVPGVLGQMGLEANVARGALRLSLGFGTSDEDIERAAELLGRACTSG
jgi:cysteine desulfurase